MRNADDKIVLKVEIHSVHARPAKSEQWVPCGTEIHLAPVHVYSSAFRKLSETLTAEFEPISQEQSHIVNVLSAIGLDPHENLKSRSFEFAAQRNTFDVVRQIHLHLLDQIIQNEDGVADNIDSEFLHDFRVAIRRTRTLISLVSKKVLSPDYIRFAWEEFRWLGSQTNRMRDLDVYLLAFPGFRAGLPARYRPALDPFRDYMLEQSRAEQRRMRALVNGRHYRRICEGWRTRLTQSDSRGADADIAVKNVADRHIARALESFVKHGSRIDDESADSDLHDLRVRGKKLRYLLEFFRGLYDRKEIEALIKPLKQLQNTFGDFQDATVQSDAILGFGKEMAAAGRAGVETQMAMGMVAETILARQDGARREFYEHFEKLAGKKNKKRFARMFQSSNADVPGEEA